MFHSAGASVATVSAGATPWATTMPPGWTPFPKAWRQRHSRRLAGESRVFRRERMTPFRRPILTPAKGQNCQSNQYDAGLSGGHIESRFPTDPNARKLRDFNVIAETRRGQAWTPITVPLSTGFAGRRRRGCARWLTVQRIDKLQQLFLASLIGGGFVNRLSQLSLIPRCQSVIPADECLSADWDSPLRWPRPTCSGNLGLCPIGGDRSFISVPLLRIRDEGSGTLAGGSRLLAAAEEKSILLRHITQPKISVQKAIEQPD